MTDTIKPSKDALYVALSFQDLYAPDREVFALRFITQDGQRVIVELPGQGAKYLRDKMAEAFAKHPEMERWGIDWKPN